MNDVEIKKLQDFINDYETIINSNDYSDIFYNVRKDRAEGMRLFFKLLREDNVAPFNGGSFNDI